MCFPSSFNFIKSHHTYCKRILKSHHTNFPNAGRCWESFQCVYFQDDSSLLESVFNQTLSEEDREYFHNFNVSMSMNSELTGVPIWNSSCNNSLAAQPGAHEENICDLGFFQMKIENFRVSITFIHQN